MTFIFILAKKKGSSKKQFLFLNIQTYRLKVIRNISSIDLSLRNRIFINDAKKNRRRKNYNMLEYAVCFFGENKKKRSVFVCVE